MRAVLERFCHTWTADSTTRDGRRGVEATGWHGMTAPLVEGRGQRALVRAHQVSHIMGRAPLERDEVARPRRRQGDGDLLTGRGPFGGEGVRLVMRLDDL